MSNLSVGTLFLMAGEGILLATIFLGDNIGPGWGILMFAGFMTAIAGAALTASSIPAGCRPHTIFITVVVMAVLQATARILPNPGFSQFAFFTGLIGALLLIFTGFDKMQESPQSPSK